MNLSKKIKKYLLNVALQRPAPQTIPRSGFRGEAVNCYVVRVFSGNDVDALIIEASNGDKFNCLKFDGETYSIKSQHSFADLLDRKFEFTHFHGLATTTYYGWLDFAIGTIFRIPYIKTWFLNTKNKISQYIFNSKKLITKQRIDLLKVILDSQLNGSKIVSSHSVITLIHTSKWYLHPNWEEEHNRVKFYLDALAETKDLTKTRDDYSITGQGIAAIERYEEEERKHSESIANQHRMFWLTLAIAALTLIQAGLIKLPALIDLTN